MSNPFANLVLFDTLDSFKFYMPVTTASKIESWYPDMVRAQEKFILPILGQELYTDLLNARIANSVDPIYTSLLHEVRKPLAHFTQMLSRAVSSVKIDSNGIRMVKSADLVTPWQWMVNDVDSYWLKGGYDGVESLLKFLLVNKDDYSAWTDSEEYEEITGFFIRTANEFRRFRKIDGQYTLSLLSSAMRDVEDITIKSNITSEIFDALKTAQVDDSLDENQAALLKHVQRVIAHLSIAKASDEIPFEISEQGISLRLRSGDHNIKQEPPDADRLSWMKKEAEQKGKAAIAEMRKYMDSVAGENVFTEYFNSDLYTVPGTTRERGYDNTDKRIFVA